MSENKVHTGKTYRAIGLMSGTSADGVDAALVETDGQGFVKPLGSVSVAYEPRMRDKIRKCFGLKDIEHPDVAEAERVLTLRHAAAVVELMEATKLEASDVDIIGFHGQTITHIPEERLSLQIGDAATLARQMGIDTVNDFRSADIEAGGQGAPFLPVYHQARAKAEALFEKAGGPVAILNIGGVSNVTYIGEEDLIAFDTGPGNALMDDFLFTKTGQAYDEGGQIAASGTVNTQIIERCMALPYFAMPLPKSLDRNSWDVSAVDYLPTEDALATLAQFTVESVVEAERMLPEKPALWMVTGGGRHNKFLMAQLSLRASRPVLPARCVAGNARLRDALDPSYLFSSDRTPDGGASLSCRAVDRH